MRYEIIEGAKARSSWYVTEDGHIYLKKTTNGSKVYLRCRQERTVSGIRCFATGVINGEQLIVIKDHNHGPQQEYLQRAHTLASLRNKARQYDGALPSEIIDQVNREEGSDMTYTNAGQIIRRVRKLYSSPLAPTGKTVAAAGHAARSATRRTSGSSSADGGEEFSFTIVTEGDEEFEEVGPSLVEGGGPDHEQTDTLSSPGGDGEEQQEIETAEEPEPLEDVEFDQADSEAPLGTSVQERRGGGVRARGLAAAPLSRPKRAYPRRQYAAKRAKTVDRSHDERVMQALDELARREEDPDRNFLLSLLPYLQKMPDNVRSKAKIHLLNHVTECAYPAE